MKIQITVKPNSRVQEVSIDGDNLVVKVKEPPEEGKANRAVVQLLAEYYRVPKSSVCIIAGLSSKHKVIEITGK